MRQLTNEFIIQRFRECTTIRELIDLDASVYSAAKIRGIFDIASAHMTFTRRKVKSRKYFKENILKEAKKYNSPAEFKEKAVGFYRAAIRQHILNEACAHMTDGILFQTNEELHQIALKYKHRGDFQKFDKNSWQNARNRGILNDICSHMIYLSRPEYSKDELLTIALKYSTLTEFEKNKPGAYNSARNQRFMDEIRSHMEIKWKQKWISKKEIHPEALKYNDRSSFIKESPGAYKAANRLKILDEVCSHMPNLGNTSIMEKNLFEIIKEKFPKTQKLRVRDKNIIEHIPKVKGFDIDIYIPELRKGIEFDGTYWHSLEGLKRGRPDWPKEDLKNYHKFKDEHFKYKGIEILHIKEEDWLKDKQKCIDKCFEFLEKGSDR